MSTQNNEGATTETSSETLRNTTIACVLAGAVTYPFDQLHTQWQTKALAKWNDQADFDTTIRKSPIRRVLSPLSRLILNEAALTLLVADAPYVNQQHSSFLDFAKAGAVSGVAVAVLLCPLEARRAVKRKQVEEGRQWWTWLQAVLPQGGRADPKERFQRAYRGIEVLAIREVAFNVSFFPLASYLKQQHQWTTSNNEQVNLVLTNVLAGSVCSLLVLPLDVWKTYLWHSSEHWNIWKGKTVVAPPLSLLYRGWTIQAFILGPAFGLVASIYDLT